MAKATIVFEDMTAPDGSKGTGINVEFPDAGDESGKATPATIIALAVARMHATGDLHAFSKWVCLDAHGFASPQDLVDALTGKPEANDNANN